ncbi:MAG: cytochrome c oxidase assembly protein [Stappia sp.]|jgi:cytochrome c oxidase assembly protein subunit 11|uniref:cytochrome c oxidase assembly protein n=1 Tax=Stappia sp. TaxID=1870903 RepID=UPI000C4074C4|nr:cytochrome c oxidase assembly protein [Stappia sp.]MAA96877.1 cytochrome c oxidase assembly protein [Stappia sp.]MBM21185.1 cytochrome c oxidase assembly protein [Stappia sp.]
MTRKPENTTPETAADEAARRRGRANRRVAIGAFGGVMLMVGAAYAAVPLYQIFCQVTGYGGTTQRSDSVTGEIIDRKITVRFDGNVNSSLPWKFGPDTHAVTLRMGETGTMSYHATNLAGDANVGTSVFNVTPFEAGAYFNKIQCFCFTEQPLAAGETAEMPVVFFVDPEMDKDPQLKHIKEITLSYTFYPDKSAETPVAAKATGAGEEKNSL